jgi:hypothetical protein
MHNPGTRLEPAAPVWFQGDDSYIPAADKRWSLPMALCLLPSMLEGETTLSFQTKHKELSSA